jgi:hypothetical protein
MVINVALEQQPPVKWADFMGNPTKVSGGMAANARLVKDRGTCRGLVFWGVFHVPDSFRPGELHRNVKYWEAITKMHYLLIPSDVVRWVREHANTGSLNLLNIIKLLIRVSPSYYSSSVGLHAG